MSSTTIAPLASDATLVVGTPQYEEYYYKKIERYVYSHMAACVKESPNLPMTKTWLALGHAGQQAVIAEIKQTLKYENPPLDIEDDERVGDTTFVLIGGQLAGMAFPTPTRNKSNGKDIKKSANPLLKTATHHARLEKQGQ